jgi:protein-L-isoaspartate(D-aspartate) O-methyltransferase
MKARIPVSMEALTRALNVCLPCLALPAVPGTIAKRRRIMNDFTVLREAMVSEQLEARGIRDPAVLAAMREIPREEFVPPEMQWGAYDDNPLPIGEGQTISQPYMVAYMSEALGLSRESRVLEIGTGSGYAAAVLSRIVDRVYTVERLAALARTARERLYRLGYTNVHVLVGDGSMGWPEHAPYDAIVVTAGAPGVPKLLAEQLAVGGRLVIPVGADPFSQLLVRVRRTGESEFREEGLFEVRFVPLVGAAGWKLS